MKIKLISLAALIFSVLGLSGCYDAYPGGYGYADPAPVYAGGYYPAGGWGSWGGWGYPAYYGRGWGWNHGGWSDWNHGGWGDNHFVVPEHGGFVAHNLGAPMGGGHGFDVAHNDAFRGGGGSGGWHGGGSGGFHSAARGAPHSSGGSHGSYSERR